MYFRCYRTWSMSSIARKMLSCLSAVKSRYGFEGVGYHKVREGAMDVTYDYLAGSSSIIAAGRRQVHQTNTFVTIDTCWWVSSGTAGRLLRSSQGSRMAEPSCMMRGCHGQSRIHRIHAQHRMRWCRCLSYNSVHSIVTSVSSILHPSYSPHRITLE